MTEEQLRNALSFLEDTQTSVSVRVLASFVDHRDWDGFSMLFCEPSIIDRSVLLQIWRDIFEETPSDDAGAPRLASGLYERAWQSQDVNIFGEANATLEHEIILDCLHRGFESLQSWGLDLARRHMDYFETALRREAGERAGHPLVHDYTELADCFAVRSWVAAARPLNIDERRREVLRLLSLLRSAPNEAAAQWRDPASAGGRQLAYLIACLTRVGLSPSFEDAPDVSIQAAIASSAERLDGVKREAGTDATVLFATIVAEIVSTDDAAQWSADLLSHVNAIIEDLTHERLPAYGRRLLATSGLLRHAHLLPDHDLAATRRVLDRELPWLTTLLQNDAAPATAWSEPDPSTGERTQMLVFGGETFAFAAPPEQAGPGQIHIHASGEARGSVFGLQQPTPEDAWRVTFARDLARTSGPIPRSTMLAVQLEPDSSDASLRLSWAPMKHGASREDAVPLVGLAENGRAAVDNLRIEPTEEHWFAVPPLTRDGDVMVRTDKLSMQGGDPSDLTIDTEITLYELRNGRLVYIDDNDDISDGVLASRIVWRARATPDIIYYIVVSRFDSGSETPGTYDLIAEFSTP